MRDASSWVPTKYVRIDGRLTASPDPKQVRIPSRLVATLIARCYDRNLPLHARGRLLDLGCGTVPLYETYRGLVSEVMCVDWGKSRHGNRHLDLKHDLNRPLPLGDAAFDTIILSDVLEHIAEPQRLWNELARVLAPGGRVLINVPFYYGLHEQPHDYYRYTEFALRRYAERAKLQVTQLERIGGAPEILADLVAKNAMRIPRVGRAIARFVQWSALRLGDTAFGRRLTDATSAQFPFNYFLVAAKETA